MENEAPSLSAETSKITLHHPLLETAEQGNSIRTLHGGLWKTVPSLWQRVLEKAQTSIKKLIVQVKNGNSIDLKISAYGNRFFLEIRQILIPSWKDIFSAQKLPVVMCNSKESAVLCWEEERDFSLCMRLWTHDHSVAFRICLRKRNPSSLVSFKILRYSRNKENRKGKQVIKNDTFYVSLLPLSFLPFV